MTRLLILHQHGGVWVDTDTVILRDFRPLVEFVGEFAGQCVLLTSAEFTRGTHMKGKSTC
jgi:hypothetical protein